MSNRGVECARRDRDAKRLKDEGKKRFWGRLRVTRESRRVRDAWQLVAGGILSGMLLPGRVKGAHHGAHACPPPHGSPC
jgi:hypothetical protein